MLYAGTTVGGDLVTWSAFDDPAGRGAHLGDCRESVQRNRVPLQQVLDSSVTSDGLQAAYCALVPKGVSQPFTAQQVRAFLSELLRGHDHAGADQRSELQVSFVPMFP